MLENDRVAEFLRESGLDKLLDKLTPEEAQRARHEITARLKTIAENAPKVEEGGTKVVIGDWSVHLTGAVWPLAKLAAKLAIAVHDPVGLTWASAADGVFQALDDLAKEVHRLDSVELNVCEAVKAKRLDNRKAGRKPDGATLKDIEAFFTEKGEEPPADLAGLIRELREKKVLVADSSSGQDCYRTSF
jgi:hypothetical protein